MSRKPEPDDELPPSKSRRKREHRALQGLAEALIALPESRFRQLRLGERAREELLVARGMGASGARNRQIRLVAHLLEDEDIEALARPVTELSAEARAATALHHRAERLRDVVLEKGPLALGFPLGAADSARLTGLRTEALAPFDAARARHARREIYRVLLALLSPPGT
ncbi:MAG: DUF615 domain-containing protein [Pseudomonadales bacterium]|jgi:ribosome-associated protein|nr:DUF615 domain-containing protein [Pseudomonadales bacterium]MBP9032688.1 DUF615 domain-containing protein [Pseudomonadales bacterium]